MGVQVPLSAPNNWLSYQQDTEAIFVCAQIVPKMAQSNGHQASSRGLTHEVDESYALKEVTQGGPCSQPAVSGQSHHRRLFAHLDLVPVCRPTTRNPDCRLQEQALRAKVKSAGS